MTRRLFTPLGGTIILTLVTVIVFSGLGWVTHTALQVESAQLQSAAQAEQVNKERLALWQLDGRLFPWLGVETNRPYAHYFPLHLPYPVVIPDAGDQAAEPVLLPSPLLAAELPDWMLLHFQYDPGTGWSSPQVLTDLQEDILRNQLAVPISVLNVTAERRQVLQQLQATYAEPAAIIPLFDEGQGQGPESPFVVPVHANAFATEVSPEVPRAEKVNEVPLAAQSIPQEYALGQEPRGASARGGSSNDRAHLEEPNRTGADRAFRGDINRFGSGPLTNQPSAAQAQPGAPAPSVDLPRSQAQQVPPYAQNPANKLTETPAQIQQGASYTGREKTLREGLKEILGRQNQVAPEAMFGKAMADPAEPSALGVESEFGRNTSDPANQLNYADSILSRNNQAMGAFLGGFYVLPSGSGNPPHIPATVAPGGITTARLIPPPASPVGAPPAAAMPAKPELQTKNPGNDARFTAPAKDKTGDHQPEKAEKQRDEHEEAKKLQLDQKLPKQGKEYFARRLLADFSRIPQEPPAVHLSSFHPLWLPTQDGQQYLVMVRSARLASGKVYQGVVLDWERLKNVLAEDVRPLFPEVQLKPVHGPIEHPERTMIAIPVELESGPSAGGPSAGLTPLRIGLIVGWIAASLALLGIGFGGWTLIELSERRIRFVSAVTHELRTPLTSLRLYLDLLLSGMIQDEKQQQEYLQTLSSESERLNHLIENVLDYARLEKRSVRANRTELRVDHILEHCQQTWAERCRNQGKELVVVSTVPSEQAVHSDLVMVCQLLGNLIDNARKYSQGAADPRIWLWVKPGPGNQVVFEVEDRGPGVNSGEVGSIFRPFRRGNHADASTGGAGLGLALAKQWAEMLGGTLSYRPADGGTGACFRLSLPTRG